jgi:hypothetical protein
MTNEQKLSVLMAYYRQKVRYIRPEMDRLHGEIEIHSILLLLSELNISNKFSFFDSHVSISEIAIPLRTVEQMTDEEIDIFRELNGDVPFTGNRKYIRLYISQSLNAITTPPKIACWDYLRSIGIATDVMGITVQEMVEDGIVTIIK